MLAERALEAGRDVEAYAYARTGYHRGLDALRRSGWKGHGPVPWAHVPNRGFLRALAALARAADIDETDEAERCRAFLADSSPEAAASCPRPRPRCARRQTRRGTVPCRGSAPRRGPWCPEFPDLVSSLGQ